MQDFEPGERALRVRYPGRFQPGHIRPRRAGDHNDGAFQRPCREQFGLGRGSAGIFGDNDVDVMFDQHLLVGALRERATRRDESCAAGQGIGRRRVHAADHVVMPGRGRERGKVFSPDGEQHAARMGPQSGGGLRHVRHLGPVISVLCLPGGTFDHQDRHLHRARSFGGVRAHLHGERMRGHDERLNGVFGEIARKPGNAAEPAAAPGNLRQARRGRAPGERERRAEPRIACQKQREGRGFARAAQDEDF